MVHTQKKKCALCKKKVGLFGFLCECHKTFCSLHRLPEQHDCQSERKDDKIVLTKVEREKLEKI